MYKSKSGHIELKITGYEEPNNGRELHIAELIIAGNNCSDKYFKKKWNKLNFNLSEFKFESEDNKFVFIPAEGNSFVINTVTLEVIYLPYKGISTVCFIKNEFEEDRIKLFYTDEIVDYNLKK